MKCKYCGKEFTALTHNAKYCSSSCGDKYRYRHDVQKENPSITFTCAWCGKTVVTEAGTKDMRTRFCSPECEKKWWRHPPYEHESARINYRSINEYASWERRTNEGM